MLDGRIVIRQYAEASGFSKSYVRSLYKKYHTKIHNAAEKGSGVMVMTFEEYAQLALDAGIWADDIGRSSNQYHLSRIGDTGDYTVGNCRFIQHCDNNKERMENGGSKSQADKITGRTYENHEGRRTQAEKLSMYYVVTSPEGVEEVCQGLNRYCRDNDISSPNYMHDVANGKRDNHKGWRARKITKEEYELKKV
ncbi:hypothetical protein VPHK397_0087 [Vibrio phage K397]